MLILTRKSGEAIRIADTIRLTVIEIKGGIVRIGIDAPDNISLWRAELYERIRSGEVSGKRKPP